VHQEPLASPAGLRVGKGVGAGKMSCIDSPPVEGCGVGVSELGGVGIGAGGIEFGSAQNGAEGCPEE